jgi:hypothetical protein
MTRRLQEEENKGGLVQALKREDKEFAGRERLCRG